jgi:hypothetical protein
MGRARENALELKLAFISGYSCQVSLLSNSRHYFLGRLPTPTANPLSVSGVLICPSYSTLPSDLRPAGRKISKIDYTSL